LPTDFQTFQPWFATVSYERTGDFKYSKLIEGAPAQNSGMPETGLIKSIDSKDVLVSKDLVDTLQNLKGKQATLNVCDDNSENCKDYIVAVSKEGTIGISYIPNYSINLKYEGVAKIFAGFTYAADQLKLMGYYLSTAFATAAQTGNYEQVAANTASSPIALYFIIDKIRQFGPFALLDILASMSFSLAIINLLPIPALDGGRIMLLGIEAVIRRPLNKKLENTIIAISFYALMGLMLIIVLKDIFLINVIKEMF
jgi:regulator of sigma E protease